MDQEDFMLRETNQIKTNTIQFHLYIKSKKQYMEQRKQYIKITNWWSLENPGVQGWMKWVKQIKRYMLPVI